MFKIEIELPEKAGGFYKISDEIYFSRPEVSNSDLNQIAKSPKAYKFYKDFGGSFKTPQMELGSLVHALYLEPAQVSARYVVAVEADRRTKLGKQIYEEFEAGAAGKKIIAREVWDRAENIYRNLLKNLGPIQTLAGPGTEELAAFWDYLDVDCRGKIDYLSNDFVIWDLKTTSNLLQFEKSVANYFYHRQAAFYGKGLASLTGFFKGFRFVVVETAEPYDSAVFELDLTALKRGVREVDELLTTFKNCKQINSWPGAFDPSHTHTIGLPKWY